MADNNEEEYLDSLLKSMVDNIGEADNTQSYASEKDSSEESYDSSEDDDMAMLSRMLLEDNDIPFDVDLNSEEATEETPAKGEEDVDFLSDDFGKYMSLDDLLSEATNNDTGTIDIPADDYTHAEITPIVDENSGSDEYNPFVLDDNEPEEYNPFGNDTESDEYDPFGGAGLFDEEVAAADTSSSKANNDIPSLSSLADELSLKDGDFDIFSDFAEIDIDSNKQNSSVNEEAVRDSVYNPPVDNGGNFEDDFQKELADILSLDDGMTLDDIPDISVGDTLSTEELNKISEMSEEHPKKEDEDESESEEATPKKNKKAKKPKKEKVKKVKKEKVKKEKAPKEPKEKKKFSFADFFSKFNDEDEESAKSVDDNQELIDKLYKDTKSLDDVDPETGKSSKKEKKKKEKKPKKPKEPKAKKEKTETPESEKVQIGNIGVAIIALLFIVFLVGGYFGGQFIHYKLTIRESKNYFEVGNYDMAYDQLSGVDIKSGDKEFYNQVRVVMVVYQGYESYNNYIVLDNEVAGLDALINAVGRKQHIEDEAIKYGVENQVNKVYGQILNILEYYGIDENYALDLYRMEDYDDYLEILEDFEGVANDSNN